MNVILRILASIPIFLFGSTFTLGGMLFLYFMAWPMISDWLDMRDWHASEAELLSFDVGEDYSEATYYYEYMGLSYEGDRVQVALFYDDQGSYHWEMYQFLNDSLRNDKDIQIWVNPYNPQEAVIDRDMRWGLLTGIVILSSIFISIGLLFTVFLISGLFSPKQTIDKEEEIEEKPERRPHEGSAQYKQAVVSFSSNNVDTDNLKTDSANAINREESG